MNRNYWIGWILVVVLNVAATAQAAVIWSQDFSDVSNWQVIYDPVGGATITTDGTQGLFYVQASSSLAAFGPINSGTSSLIAFDPLNASDYSMYFDVNAVTWSTSYHIALDQFDASGTYLNTVWLFDTTTYVGFSTVELGTFSFDANTAYILPKLEISTGDGGQTVTFGALSFSQVPEPTTAILVLMGIFSIFWGKRRRMAELR